MVTHSFRTNLPVYNHFWNQNVNHFRGINFITRTLETLSAGVCQIIKLYKWKKNHICGKHASFEFQNGIKLKNWYRNETVVTFSKSLHCIAMTFANQ